MGGGGGGEATSFRMPEHGHGTRRMLKRHWCDGFGLQHMADFGIEATDTFWHSRKVWCPCVLVIVAQYVSFGVIALLDLIEKPREGERVKGYALQVCQHTPVNLVTYRSPFCSDKYLTDLGEQQSDGGIALCGDYINRDTRLPLFECLHQAMGNNHVANTQFPYNQRSAIHAAYFMIFRGLQAHKRKFFLHCRDADCGHSAFCLLPRLDIGGLCTQRMVVERASVPKNTQGRHT